MEKLVLVLVCFLMPLGSFCDSVPEPSVFEGFKGMLPENIVQDMQALKPEDVSAVKRLLKTLHMADNFTEAISKESPRVFNLVRDVVHAFKARKDEAFAKFIPETNEFVVKLQAILEDTIEETAAAYKLEKDEVKENLRTVFPKAMFIIEHPTFK